MQVTLVTYYGSKDDFGYGEEQCGFSFHSYSLSRVMNMDWFWLWLSLLVEKAWGGGDVFQEIHELLMSFIGIISQKPNKTLLCYLFYHLVKQVARPAHKKKAWMALTRSISWLEVLLPMGRGIQRKMITMTLLSPFSPLTKLQFELGPAPSLGQASHSDSEMVIYSNIRKIGNKQIWWK